MRIITTVMMGLMLFFFMNKQLKPAMHSQPFSRMFNPFDHTVYYRIGQVDPRFNLTPDQLAHIAQDAARIWQQASPAPALAYHPSARLTINLLYDQRQAETRLRHDVQLQLENQLQQQQQQASQLKSHQAQLLHEQQQISSWRASLEQQQQRLNDHIAAWNAQGHIDDYTRQQIAQQLAQQQWQLQQQQQQLDASISRYNAQVQQLNQHASQFNQQVSQYNHRVDDYRNRFSPREFEKGAYDGRQITIYEFGSRDELTLTIAHELGHALGLKHNNDPFALMYPILQQQKIHDFRLTAADRAMLAH